MVATVAGAYVVARVAGASVVFGVSADVFLAIESNGEAVVAR